MTEETGPIEAVETAIVEAPSAPETAPEPRDDRSAVDRAFDRVFDENGQPRGPDGKFAPKVKAEDAAPETPAEPTPPAPPVAPVEPPADLNLSPAAKAAWAAAAPELRADVERRISEVQAGLTRYQERFGPLAQHAEAIERQGGSIAQVFQGYVEAENMLRQNPIAGLNAVCQNLGIDLRAVAAHVMGQPAPERDAVIDGLRAELEAIKGQVGTVAKTFEQQRIEAATQTVQQFAATAPRFNELAGEIQRMLQTGYIDPRAPDALQRAYEIADRANPAPQPAAIAAPPAAEAANPPAARTRKADLSINGAPGSDPTTRPRSKSTTEAIDRAFGLVGL